MAADNSRQKRLLLVAADSELTTPDLLEEEAETISTAYANADKDLDITFARPSTEGELFDHLTSTRPNILHFSGHGNPVGDVMLRTTQGPFRRKTAKSIARIISGADIVPECILFNNCAVFRTEERLLSVCDNLVRMKPRGVFDYSIVFAQSFYSSLDQSDEYEAAFGKTISKMTEAGLANSIRVQYRRGDPTMTFERPRFARTSADEAAHAPRERISIEEERGRKFRVWFGTNRRPVVSTKAQLSFGPDRDTKVHYGYCDVFIPKHHKIGSVGAPWWKRWPVWQDDRLRVISVSALDTQEFWALIQHELSVLSAAERTILLFIHGYAVSFERAAIRAAQFGADLKVLGVTAFFSWPSRGRVQDYAPDAASIEASEAPLRIFLEDLSVKSGAERIHVIVHSMGNRGVIRAFNAILAQAADNSKIRFGQIFLAAPDIDAEVFKQLARAYPQLSERTTMYISGHDKALLGAGYLYDYPRAGYKPPTTIVEGIDTVEVSAIDLSFLGHGYISGARPVLTDMHSLMLANTPPERRMGIEAALDPEADLTYWRIKA